MYGRAQTKYDRVLKLSQLWFEVYLRLSDVLRVFPILDVSSFDSFSLVFSIFCFKFTIRVVICLASFRMLWKLYQYQHRKGSYNTFLEPLIQLLLYFLINLQLLEYLLSSRRQPVIRIIWRFCYFISSVWNQNIFLCCSFRARYFDKLHCCSNDCLIGWILKCK